MAIFEGLLGLGVAILLGSALAEYAKFRHKAEKGWNWLMLGGTWFLFAGSFGVASSLGSLINAPTIWLQFGQIFEALGWLFALIGAIFVAYETIFEK